MRRTPIVLWSVALVLALTLGWASAMAQTDGQFPVVDWPSEARFIQDLPVSAEITEVAWPSEVRYIELKPFATTESGVLVQMDWPSEARFVVVEPQQLAAAEEAWPSEARFIALMPVMPLDATAQVTAWPSEARYVDIVGYARLEPAQLPGVELANKEIYKEVVESFFEAGDAQPLFAHYPEALAQVRVEEWIGWQHAFEGLQPTLDFQIAEGDRVLSCWIFTGVHMGEFMGVAPTQQPVTFRVLYSAQLVDGMVVEEIGELELTPLLDQLDVQLAPQPL